MVRLTGLAWDSWLAGRWEGRQAGRYLDLEGCQECGTPLHPVEQDWRDFQPSAIFIYTANAFTLKLGHSVPPSIMKSCIHVLDSHGL